MRYIVYKNNPNKRITIHRESCNYPKMHGGVSTVIPPTGEYVEDIPTFKEARDWADSFVGWYVRECSVCRPDYSDSLRKPE